MTDVPASVTSAVLAWGAPRLRDLPWRHTRDPWAVLVSEVMLQQTQVARVIPKWLAFLEVYPTPSQCAEAPLGDVLRLWQGLGYPRRARNLHETARRVVELGGFPDTLAGLLELPGVGQYTARAVLAFAFEQDAAVVDTNIARIYARLLGRRLTARQVQATADSALASGDAWFWNQAIMDLGAVVCRPALPGCDECPLAESCAWRGRGDDPAQGSAGVSGRQGRFEGSDRQARGRLLRALSEGTVDVNDVADVIGRPADAAARVLDGLIRDGLCLRNGDSLHLP